MLTIRSEDFSDAYNDLNSDWIKVVNGTRKWPDDFPDAGDNEEE